MKDRRPRFEASRERRDQLAQRFFAAAEAGDLAALEELLARDVVLHGDGGGRAPSIVRALHGRTRVAVTLLAWARAARRSGGFSFRQVEVNGQPGALVLDTDDRLIGVLALDIADGHIQAVSSVVNPDKLQHLGPLADLQP